MSNQKYSSRHWRYAQAMESATLSLACLGRFAAFGSCREPLPRADVACDVVALLPDPPSALFGGMVRCVGVECVRSSERLFLVFRRFVRRFYSCPKPGNKTLCPRTNAWQQRCRLLPHRSCTMAKNVAPPSTKIIGNEVGRSTRVRRALTELVSTC